MRAHIFTALLLALLLALPLAADAQGPKFRVAPAAELNEPVDISVADHRLAMPRGPALRASIEIQPACEHRVPFDRIEQVGVALEIATERE